MDKDEYKDRIKKQIEVMEAYLEGKDIQVSYGGGIWEDTEHPEWNWDVVKYRVKPDEVEKPKKLMTFRQLAELMVKGYGEWSFDTEEMDFHTEVGYGLLNTDKELDDDILIRPWGSKELRKPTVDVYEEYVSKWNRAFSWANELTKGGNKSESRPQDCSQSSSIKDYSDDYAGEPEVGEIFKISGRTLKCIEEKNCKGCAFQEGPSSRCPDIACSNAFRKDGKSVVFVDVSKMEDTTSEESSSTENESVGVHKRTPQEIADFFNCYVAMDEDGYWYLYSEEPIIVKGDFICCSMAHYWSIANCDTGEILAISKSFLLLNAEEDHDWRTLYRPHREPIVMEVEDEDD